MRSRKVVLPADYYARAGAYRQLAFSVAGVAAIDALDGVLAGLTQALADGESFADWRRRAIADPALAALPVGRLDTIFRTNVQGAYARGTYQRQAEVAPRRRFLMYDAINDSRTRPAHRALDNVIAPHDDPFWKTHRPPLGYRCRCTLIALTEAQARDRGYTGAPPPADVQPDPGWAYDRAEGIAPGVQAAVRRRAERGGPIVARAAAAIRGYLEAAKALVFSAPDFSIYDIGAPRVAADIGTPARAAAVAVEMAIRRDANETAVVIGADGVERFRTTGKPDQVVIPAVAVPLLADATFTHNHPRDGTFSLSDVRNAAASNVAELRAVGPDMRHIMLRTTRWPSRVRLEALIRAAAPRAQRIVADMIARGELDRRNAQAEKEHQVWVEVARRAGLTYHRERS